MGAPSAEWKEWFTPAPHSAWDATSGSVGRLDKTKERVGRLGERKLRYIQRVTNPK